MHNLIRFHPRVWIAVIAGIAVFFFLPQHWSLISRILVSWNCGVMLFLVLILYFMTHLSAEKMCDKYIEEDESAQFILTFVVFAALLSVAAIVEPLATLKQTSGTERIAHIALAAMTLVNSWLLVPMMFTTHYADMFYSVPKTRAKDRPLVFPNTPMPAFWDFAYFSFTIAAACQTSDVCTNNASIRKIVLAHTLVSFVFNASILGFAINVTAGLIGGG
jgi:uncharacterized membrane protein